MTRKRAAKPLKNVSALFNSRKGEIGAMPSMETMVGKLKRLKNQP
jgi:hypothetical protein